MKLNVTLERKGDHAPEVVKISPLAWIGWEEYSGRRMSDMAKSGLGMADLAQLTMEQLRLEGDTSLELSGYREWLAGVADLSPEGDVVEVPPTGGEPSDGP